MTISQVKAVSFFESFADPKTFSIDTGTGDNRKIRCLVGRDNGTPVVTSMSIGSDTLTLVGTAVQGPGSSTGRFYCYEGDLTVTGTQTGTVDYDDASGGAWGVVQIYQGSAGALTFGTPTWVDTESGSAGSFSGSVTATTSDKVALLLIEGGGLGAVMTPTSPATQSSDLGTTGYLSLIRDGLSGSTSIGAAAASGYGVIGFAFTISEAGAAPVITGPSGAAGAASSTANVAENSATGPTFSTSIALGGGFPTLTGTDASLWTLTTLSSTSWRVDPNPAKNFEIPTDAGGNNVHDVVFNASASVSQSCAITITNVNEAPTFAGPDISVPTLTEGVAMTPINAALLFTDPDSGDTGTYAKVGTWPTGVDVSAAGTIGASPNGTPGAGTAAAYSNLRVRRTDGGGLTADSNLFTITVNAAAAGPTINTHPSNQTAKIGAAATFTVAATTSGGALSYQWRLNGNPISGATSASYTRTGVVLGDHGGVYTCAVTDSNGTVISNSATLTVAVTFSGTVPDFVGTTGASGSIDLSSYFAGGLARTFAVLSGTMPTGLSQVGTTAVWSGTLGAAGSGSFVVRATDSATNTDVTNTVDWVIGATTPGTIVSEPLVNNNNVPLPNTALTWIGFRNLSNGASVLVKTGESTNSSAQFSVSDVALTTGQSYLVDWVTAAGERGHAVAVAA